MRLLVSLQREDWLHGPNHGVLPLPKRLTPSRRPLDLACPLHAGPPSPPVPVGSGRRVERGQDSPGTSMVDGCDACNSARLCR